MAAQAIPALIAVTQDIVITARAMLQYLQANTEAAKTA